MPVLPCPKCGRVGRRLDEASRDAYVNYYRCDTCGHVWNVSKDNPDAPSQDVTRPAKADLRPSTPQTRDKKSGK